MGISASQAAISVVNPEVSTTVHSTDLVERIRAGDRRAESEFAQVFSRRLLLVLMRKTSDPEIARECCQKTLLIALVKMRAGEILRPKSLMAFLRCTASNVVITYFRTERRYASLGDRMFLLEAPAGDVAARDLDHEVLLDLLIEALDRLPMHRDREILSRFYLHEESKQAICQDYDLKPEHFDRVLHRARTRARKLLNSDVRLQEALNKFL